MNKVEFAANAAAAAVTAFGAGMVHGNTMGIHEARDTRDQLLDDRAAVIQEYREENPGTTTIPVEIEDTYAPKIEKASDRLDAERAESWKSITVAIGGLTLLGGAVVFTEIRSRRRTDNRIDGLYDRIDNLTTNHTDLLNRYRDRYMEDNNFGQAPSPYDDVDTRPFRAITAPENSTDAPLPPVEQPTFEVLEKPRPAVTRQPEFVVESPRPQPGFTVERPVQPPAAAEPALQPVQQPRPAMPAYPQPAATPSPAPTARRHPRKPVKTNRKRVKGV